MSQNNSDKNTATALNQENLLIIPPVELSALALDSNPNGFAINAAPGSLISRGAGDVNGDGLDDLILGDPLASPNGGESGQSYVVFGKADGTAVELTDVIAGTSGFAINGEATSYFGDLSGSWFSSAGDINGDGLADLIVGTASLPYTGIDKSYVVFGKADGTTVELSEVAAGNGGFLINGDADYNWFSLNLKSARDVNGDGLTDLIFGSFLADDRSAKSYVVFGKMDSATIELSNISAGIGGFTINGEAAGDGSSVLVSSAGDINGDGLNDLVIGAADTESHENASGKSYVIFGKTNGTKVEISDIEAGIGGFAINGETELEDGASYSVGDAGDINGDGLDDLIIGASSGHVQCGHSPGKSYVVFGKADSTTVELSEVAAGNGGFVINGETELFGTSFVTVSKAGDVNGDGLDDLIIGNSQQDRSYLVFGKVDGTAVNLNEIASGVGGFAINGAVSSVGDGAGDVNGDGFDDLTVSSYVIFGGDFTGSVTQQGTSGDDILTGTSAADVIVAGQGNDTLVGNGGADILYAGAGDDVVAISDLNFNRIKTGNGTDTLRLDGNGLYLDLTTIANNRITGIEQIDLRGAANNSLNFSKLDLLALADHNQLVVLGNTGNSLTSENQGWIANGTETLSGELYNKYTIGVISLLVDTDISQLVS